MNSPAYPECDRCSFRHGPGPCLTVRVLPPAVEGRDLGSLRDCAIKARRGAAQTLARINERRRTQKEAQRLRGIKRGAAMRVGLERAAQWGKGQRKR